MLVTETHVAHPLVVCDSTNSTTVHLPVLTTRLPPGVTHAACEFAHLQRVSVQVLKAKAFAGRCWTFQPCCVGWDALHLAGCLHAHLHQQLTLSESWAEAACKQMRTGMRQ